MIAPSVLTSPFNSPDDGAAKQAFLTTCGSASWAEAMTIGRPYGDLDALLHAADDAFDALGTDDWLQTFKHHPRIGDISRLRERFSDSGGLSEGEQAGLEGAEEATLQALHQGNLDYEARFGHVFLICATGKSAAQMLASLNARIHNDAATELRIAGDEQRKITRIRLRQALL